MRVEQALVDVEELAEIERGFIQKVNNRIMSNDHNFSVRKDQEEQYVGCLHH
ncbi:MAG: hypothetical protein ACFFC7_14675 [Candidatus Hermodarchaeota archaeon]